jgi:hypothetical protein
MVRWWVSGLILSLVPSGCAYSAQQRASGWVRVETEHVRLRTSLSKRRATEIAWELERIRSALAGSVLSCAFEGKPTRLPVTVLPASEFHDIVPADAAGQYRRWRVTWLEEYEGEIILPDDLGRDTRRVYQHELVHHLVGACLPRAPVWLNEGLAKFFETAVVKNGRVVVGRSPYLLGRGNVVPKARRARGESVVSLALASLPPVERVVAMRDKDFYVGGSHGSSQVEANYATAWGLVHLLELGAADLQARFREFLASLGRLEGDPLALFQSAFGGAGLEARLTAYLARRDLPVLERAADAGRRSAVSIHPMSAGEAHLHWAWLWAGAPNSPNSRRRTLEHLAAAKDHPAMRARAHLLAAALLYLDRDLAGVEREVKEGLRAAPGDPALLHATLDLRLAHNADPSTAAARLRPVARTADQICAVARAKLVEGDPVEALSLATTGLTRKRNSWLCWKCAEVARHSLKRWCAAEPGADCPAPSR